MLITTTSAAVGVREGEDYRIRPDRAAWEAASLLDDIEHCAICIVSSRGVVGTTSVMADLERFSPAVAELAQRRRDFDAFQQGIPPVVAHVRMDSPIFGSGWHAFQSDRQRWTSEPDAGLSFRLDRVGEIRLAFGVRSLAPVVGEDTWVGLRVNATELPVYDVRRAYRRYSWTVPAEAWQRGMNHVWLRTGHLESPLVLGIGDDPRNLGLGVSGVRLELLSSSVFDVFQDGVPPVVARVWMDSPIFGSGWHAVRSDRNRWTSEPDAGLSFRLDRVGEIRVAFNARLLAPRVGEDTWVGLRVNATELPVYDVRAGRHQYSWRSRLKPGNAV